MIFIKDLKYYLGKEVKVVVDRPIGSKHPNYDWTYPLNYGYIPNTISGDNEEIDVFILGEDKPLKEFIGTCIAIIHRNDDNEEKLVIAAKNKEFSEEEIKQATYFQEKFFDSIIIK